MSLERLTAMRLGRLVPQFVWVVLGSAPKWFDQPTQIVVRADQNPFSMDWRPLVGLHVDVFALDTELMPKALQAIESANPKLICLATKKGVVGLSEEHERVLARVMERLWN